MVALIFKIGISRNTKCDNLMTLILAWYSDLTERLHGQHLKEKFVRI